MPVPGTSNLEPSFCHISHLNIIKMLLEPLHCFSTTGIVNTFSPYLNYFFLFSIVTRPSWRQKLFLLLCVSVLLRIHPS
jgi:hypothetical protein